MKVKNFIFIYLLLFSMVLVTACSSSSKEMVNLETSTSSATEIEQANRLTQQISVNEEDLEAATSNEIFLIDTAGREHTLQLPIERVVVINRNTAEAMHLLGLNHVIVGTGDTTIVNNAYLGFDNRPDVGRTSEVNIELVISLEPDVVFTYTNRPDSLLEEKLEPAGIRVIRMNNYLPDQMVEEMRLLGKLFKKEKEAEAFLSWKHKIEDLLEERVSQIPDEEKKTVLALSVGFLNSNGGYRIFPSQSLGMKPGVGEGYATLLAGGKDAADLQWDPTEASTTILVDEEYVLTKNPDVITLHGTWLGGYESETDEQHREVIHNILTNTSVSRLKAGQEKALYIFHTNVIGSDKRYIGVLQLAKLLYPERFADINPEAYLKAYFEEWLGVPYQGVWFYAAHE